MTYFRPVKNKKNDSGNSTSTPLLANATFTGEWIDVSDYSEAIISILTDQDSAVGGLKIESSLDGITTAHYHSFSPQTNTPEGHHCPSTLDSNYLRVSYTNGSTAQATFKLITTLFQNPPEEGHVHSLEYIVGSDHPASINRSVLVAKKPSGDYGNIGSTSGGNLKVSIEEIETDTLEAINLYPVGTGTNGAVTLTTANTAYAVPASAPAGSYKMLVVNVSDSMMYFGYQDANSNGIPVNPGARVEVTLGAGEQIYAYCASTGRELVYTAKLVN